MKYTILKKGFHAYYQTMVKFIMAMRNEKLKDDGFNFSFNNTFFFKVKYLLINKYMVTSLSNYTGLNFLKYN